MKLPETPTIEVSVRKLFFEWWTRQHGVDTQEDEAIQLTMPRAAWRELWRYIRECEELIENTRVRGK